MSGLQTRTEDSINGVDVREHGNTLRVATNIPHLVSLGSGRLSTAVTLHPIKQGRVTIGSDPTCDIYIVGPGVASVHCRVESSAGVLTLYPLGGVTMLEQSVVSKPVRLEQGCMLTLGRCNYLRFNNPEEAKLMKSVLPTSPASECGTINSDYINNHENLKKSYYTNDKLVTSESLKKLNEELDSTLKEMTRIKKPPTVPKKPYKEVEITDSDQEMKSKPSSIMAKVNKFEYYAKQHRNVGRSQFYTTQDNEISPKVFSSNSLTVNTPAKDVLGGRTMPNYIIKQQDLGRKDYVNVAIKNNTKFNDMVKSFDDKVPRKVNNEYKVNMLDVAHIVENDILYDSVASNYENLYERSWEAETMRNKAYQDRVKEQEQKEAETARLEEILNMCAEYEKQISTGIPITPTEKRAHNKIITNGSLPRSAAMNNPNFVQTSDGYYKFETSQHKNNSMNKSLPVQRNVSSYENYDVIVNSYTETSTQENSNNHNYENVGRMDEIGIPVFDDAKSELSSPILIKKLNQSDNSTPKMMTSSPIGSPYENVNRSYLGFKPKSPNTQSPRTRIKTTFAHKNLPSPQYFVFPTPPPTDKKPNFENRNYETVATTEHFTGIEKQLSLEEELPMIDDSNLTNDIEFRHSNVITEKTEDQSVRDFIQVSNTETNITNIIINKSFDEVKKELMADIPELEEFERDLKENKNKTQNAEVKIKSVIEEIKKIDVEQKSIDSSIIDDNVEELKSKFDNLKEERKKLMTEIHEVKCKMSQIRLHEDDVLRELEMEKALIKGEYDSEIAILNLEQKKRTELSDKLRQIEEEIRSLKSKQEARQNEMRERVDIATLKCERLHKDVRDKTATLEELQNAQDILENESKIYEDLEFQHLEEESELLSQREDLQNEMTVLTKKIEAQKQRILTLKSEATSNLTSALDETKVLQAEYVRLLNQVEMSTTRVQNIEKEIKILTTKLNDIERTQSPDSAFYTDQTRTKSGEFGYSPQSSDSDDLDLAKIANYEEYNKQIKDKLIDQMSQSMIVDIERRVNGDINDFDSSNESPTKTSTSKEKKGFWERNFDSLKRKNKNKTQKSPEKTDIMSQSLNENMFYNNENIENDLDRFNSLRNSKKDKKDGPVKSHSSSKIPTFAAFGKIIKRDSLSRRNRENTIKDENEDESPKKTFVKQTKPSNSIKYNKAKSLSPEKNKNNEQTNEKTDKSPKNKVKQHRKSCGDEPSANNSGITENNKIPSQDDIDRISKVTMDAPILSSEDVNTLGKKTFDSLMEIERKRMEMLEEQGCQVIENEREKISELKRRAQNETIKLWDQKYKTDLSSLEYNDTQETQEKANDPQNKINNLQLWDQYRQREQARNDDLQNKFWDQKTKLAEQLTRNGSKDRSDYNVQKDQNESSLSVFDNSTFYDDPSGVISSSSIEELQVRNSLTEDEKRSNDSRPLSHASDFSRDTLSVSGRWRAASGRQRPLTRYLPVDRDDFDLRTHIDSAGHQVELCPHVTVTRCSCRGYLHKLGAKFHSWSKRWFVFDRESKTFVYYWDKSEKKPRGGAYFQVIEEVYLDHGNTSKSPNPQTTFIVKTRQRRYYLMAPSGEAARIWIDVIFTGAQGYTDYLEN